MLSPESKVKAQSVGQFLSNMMMPNIGAFIAWGLLSALFIPNGWIPNQDLAALVDPMIHYLLPILIAYTGGRLISGERGAVVGAIAAMGLIAGSDIPMLTGAMVVGPLGGWAIQYFDDLFKHRVRSGFEMLVNNFSAGVIGMLGAIAGFYFIGPMIEVLSAMFAAGADVLVQSGTLAFISIIIEPAKILFLNNAINHGIFSPLGVQQTQEFGQSIFFLLESNPGPGLGLLLAYVATNKGKVKQTAGGASIIHLFGGIQEVYFPYVLMKPRLILALIAGGMSGIFTLTLFDAGLVSAASPGSIVSILLMTSKSSFLGVSLSIVISTLVSYLFSVLIIKAEKRKENLSSTNLTEQSASRSASDVYELKFNALTELVRVNREHVCLGMTASSKEDVIRLLGQKLVDLGHVEPEYIDGMIKREELLSTYLGESIALPHGMVGGTQYVNTPGIVFGQIPEGLRWGEEYEDIAHIVVAIAAKGESHIQIISSISNALDDDQALERLKITTDVDEVVRVLNGDE